MNIEDKAFQNTKEFTNGGLKGALTYSALAGKSENQYKEASSGGVSFKGELEKILKGTQEEDYGNYNIENILADMDFVENINLETVNIDKADAMFFVNLINQSGLTNYTLSADGTVIDGSNYKSIEVSKTLSSLLLKASESKKAVRLDFDNNVTVILKLSEEGKVDARFIPGDRIVEEYLKNNIPYLKQRFDDANIPYANISYKGYKGNKQRENEQNSKEKNNE